MKVKIGNYKSPITPYSIAETIFFWCDKYATYPEIGGDPKLEDRWDFKAKEWLSEFLAYGFQKRDPNNKYLHDSRTPTWFFKALERLQKNQKRTIKIKIDPWDSWSADTTLSYIIVPLLEQLKKTKQGAPYVDDADVPEDLRSTSAPPKENEWDIDDNHFKRWDWVLDEMIWANQQNILAEEPNFWIEKPEGMFFKPVEGKPEHSTIEYDKEGKFDTEAYKQYNERKQNGFRLMGRYWSSLWD